MIAVGWFVDASFRASAFLIMGGVLRVSVWTILIVIFVGQNQSNSFIWFNPVK